MTSSLKLSMIKLGGFVHSFIMCCRLPGYPCSSCSPLPLFQHHLSTVFLGQDISYPTPLMQQIMQLQRTVVIAVRAHLLSHVQVL